MIEVRLRSYIESRDLVALSDILFMKYSYDLIELRKDGKYLVLRSRLLSKVELLFLWNYEKDNFYKVSN